MANIFHNAFNFMTPGRKSSSDRGQEIVLGKKHSVKNRSHLKSYNSTPLDAATWDCHSFINAIIQVSAVIFQYTIHHAFLLNSYRCYGTMMSLE